MVEVSFLWVELVKRDLEREIGAYSLANNRVSIPQKEARLDLLAELILRNATVPQRDDPRLLVGCASQIYLDLGWEDSFNPEAFRRQFQRVQNEQGRYPPSDAGRQLRLEKARFVQLKNKRFEK